MFNRITLLLLIFFLFRIFPSYSQELNYIHYTANDGLPSSTVYRVLQDKKGFIWFATELGVSRFDGKRFTNFSSKEGLADNTILEMYEDSKGRIWFLGISGRAAYYYNGLIHSGINDNLLKKINSAGWLTGIVEDSAGNIFIGSKSAEIYKIQDNQIEIIKSKFPVYSLFINETNDIYCSSGNNFYQFRKDGTFTPLISDSFLTNRYQEYGIDKGTLIDNRIFFSFRNNIGIIEFHKEKKTFKEFKEVSESNIQYLKKNNNLLFTGTKRGALILNESLKVKAKYLENKLISCIYSDKENNLWFSTLNEGVYVLPENKIYSYFSTDSKELKVNDLLYSNHSHTLFAATDNGNLVSMKDNKFEYNTGFNGFPDKNRLLDIIETKSNDILGVSDYSVFSEKQKKFQISDIKHFTPDKKIISGSNGYFVGSYNHLRYQTDTKFTFLTTGRISTIFEDRNKNLWVGESKGLFKLSESKKDSLIATNEHNLYLKANITEDVNFEAFGKKDSVLSFKPNDIKQTSDGAIWVALQGKGLARIPINGSIQKFNSVSGLSSDICKVILPENDTVIWVGTNNGLNRLSFSGHDFADMKVKVIKANSGLTSDDINALEFQGDTLWVGTHSGLSFFTKSQLSDNSIPPPVYITNIKINGADTLVQQNISLQYQQNSIEFDFVGLSYQIPNSVLFKYKLEGLDSEWKTTTSSYIQYNFLPPNTYKFFVLATNNDGIWSTVPDSLLFTIRPPFYETRWFISMMILLSALITFGFVQFRIQQVKNREEFKTKLNQAVVEGELKSLRSQMNPHFIFNSMNSIKYFISKNDSDSANKYLSKFSKLIRLILDNSRHHSISLSEELSALQLYLELESMRFEGKFSYEISVSPDLKPENTEIPSMMLQPFVENSIIHGIMPKSSAGKVFIGVSRSNNQLLFVIDDDGVGRKKNEHSIDFHQSVGISVTRQRLEIMTASLTTKSEIKITDKIDAAGNPAGTKVVIVIPVETD